MSHEEKTRAERFNWRSGFQNAKTKLHYKCISYLHEGDFHQRETEGAVGWCGSDPVADGIVRRGFSDKDRGERMAGALEGWRPSLEENSCRETENQSRSDITVNDS